MKKSNVPIVLFLVLLVCGVVWIGILGFVNKEVKFSPKESLSEINIFDKKAIEERKNFILKNGKDISLSGTLEVIIWDDFKNWKSTNQYSLMDSNGKKYRIYFNGESNLVSGTKISIEGKETNNEISITDYKIVDSGLKNLSNPVLGEKKVAVVLIRNVPNYNYREPSFYQDLVFNQSGLYKVNNWVSETSYERTWLNGDVFGWYDIHQGEYCWFILSQDFINELINLGVNLQEYDYLHVIRPGNCSALGFGTLGKIRYMTPNGEISIGVSLTAATDDLNVTSQGVVYIITHELGHNFGLGHASRLHCYGDLLRDDCRDIEYGNFYSMMARSFFQSFDSAHKSLLGWLEADDIVEVSQSREYIIGPYEISSAKPKVLKIQGTGKINFTNDWGNNLNRNISDFYIEFRRPISYDNFFSGTGWWNGTNFYVPADYQEGAYMSLLLENDLWSYQVDLNPGQPSNSGVLDGADVILRQGQTSNSIKYGFNLTVLEVTNNSLRVKINFFKCGNNVIEGDEECDDGNTITSDCCTNNCTIARCGDGICANSISCNEKCGIFPPGPNGYCEADCGPCISSFPAGTKITTADEKEKNIENIKAGDLVLSYNEKTNFLTKSKVLQVFVHDADSYYIINGKIKVTAEHPIWANGKWKKVSELKVGDALMTKDKIYQPVYSISYVGEKIKVYNLQVEDTQTYFAEGILVHNKPPDPCQRLCEERTIPSYLGEKCSKRVCESLKRCRFVDIEGGQCLPMLSKTL